MSALVHARGVSKHYGATRAVDNVSFDIESGRIVGLIGPNGAGKTTLLKGVLGHTECAGDLSVCGLNPFRQRKALMQQVSYVADVAVLPRWIKVDDLLKYTAAMHPRFSIADTRAALAKTKISLDAKVKELSKGMVAQLHLSIILAIDAQLLILDEPTLGLDILFRKSFYTELLEDYYDGERTIIITTHQVEEIENILTDVMFIDDGKIVLNETAEKISETFFEVMAAPDMREQAQALGPIAERQVFGKTVFTFEGVSRDKLTPLGETHRLGLADLFVAKMTREAS